jgi:CubicO group peptidase (beta-lactamase class C family)
VTTTGNLYERNTSMNLLSRRALLRGASAGGATATAAIILGPSGRFAGVADAAAAAVGRAQATPAAGSPPEIPDTAIGREFASWLAAVNSHDPDTLLAHHKTYDSRPSDAEAHAAFDLMISKQWDTLILHRVDEATETKLTALVEATLSEEWLSINMERVGKEQQAFDLMPADPLPGVLPAAPLDDDALAAELGRYLAKLSAADVFSGAVLVARGGEPVFTGAYGTANAAQKTPNRVSTRFNLGSMNKMFTSVAIAQLEEAGELAFTDTIAQHLPDYPNAAVAEKVTIHHLLTHTSGLGDFFGPKYQAAKERLHTLQDYLALFVDEPLQFEPGARFQYSNAGFIVLGLIVEARADQDYFDHVREAVYRPAGMSATDSFERDAGTPDLATGYTFPLPENPADLKLADVLGGRKPNDDFLSPRGTSAGGGYSTVGDLLRFDRALRAATLLEAATVATLIEGKVDAPPKPGVRYGYGFEDDRSGPTRIVGHGGGAPGISAKLDMYWDLGATVVALGNYDRVAELVAMKAKRLLAPR